LEIIIGGVVRITHLYFLFYTLHIYSQLARNPFELSHLARLV